MPTIHMDVEKVKEVLELMKRDETAIQDTLNKAKGEIDAINGKEWIGNAVEQLSKEYDTLHGQLTTQLIMLDILAARMGQEIAEWEALAAKLV